MLTDLLQNIYNRIAQLGVAIQGLKKSLDALNQNIEDKITTLTEKISSFSGEIEITQTTHVDLLKQIGGSFFTELESLQKGIGLEDMNKLIANLESFSTIAEDVLNQETVNLLLSEAIESVKNLKAQPEIQDETISEEASEETGTSTE
jgi:hypothetical protein